MVDCVKWLPVLSGGLWLTVLSGCPWLPGQVVALNEVCKSTEMASRDLVDVAILS